MPIDFAARTAQDEQALLDMLEKRRLGISGTIQERRNALEQGRNAAFSGFQGKLGSIGQEYGLPGLNADTSGVQRRLGTALDEQLSGQQFGMQRDRVNLAYNRALDRAQQAGLDRRSSEDFARQIMQDEIRRQQEATMNEKQRQQKIKQQEISNRAFAKGEDIQAQTDDGSGEYQAAMYRILSGLPTQLLSYYMLNRNFGSETNQVGTGTSSYQPQYPQLNERPSGNLG